MPFKLSIRNISLLAFIWLNVGFALGFSFLMGPVRWIANYSRENNFSENREGMLVKILLIILLAISCLISLLISSRVIKATSKRLKLLVPLLCLLVGGWALYELLHPQNLKAFASQQKDISNNQFIFGPYPTVEDLKKYKEEGFTTIISLLHPAVTPFEPVLLKQEEENCQSLGLTLISIPMLPWISENGEALNRIKKIAQHPSGKYYVHCYLGKDRVNLVKRFISEYNQKIAIISSDLKARSLDSISSFERGEITKIKDGIYFTPYPTGEEYTGYLISGGVQQVVSLMDSTDKEQKPRIEEERKLLATYHIPFKVVAIRSAKDKKQLAELKKLLLIMPRPIVIHRFFSNKREDKEILEALKNG